MNNNEVIAEFDRCPGYREVEGVLQPCGSTRRFAGEVTKEQREKGAIGEGLRYGLYQIGGPILDPRKVNQMLLETMVPVTLALLDVCMDCGCVYAIRLERQEIPLGDIIKSPPGAMTPPGFTMGKG